MGTDRGESSHASSLAKVSDPTRVNVIVKLNCRWPVDLPSLEVIEHVVGVFFERVPLIPKMLHKTTFKANLQLPPTHWKFPVSHKSFTVSSPDTRLDLSSIVS